MVEEVADGRRHDARGAVGRRRHHLRAGGVLLVDGDGIDRDPVVDGVRRGQVLPALGQQALVDPAGAAAHLEPARQDAVALEAAVDAVGHHRPEPRQPGVDLGRGSQRALVGALERGDAEPGRLGARQRARRRSGRDAGPRAVGAARRAGELPGGQHEAAADRIVGLLQVQVAAPRPRPRARGRWRGRAAAGP